MAASIGTIQTTIELWHRRHAPEGPDISRALHIARLFEEDSASPTFLRGIAWHLVREIHDAAGWDIPGNVNLSQCRGAAASIEHAAALFLQYARDHFGNIFLRMRDEWHLGLPLNSYRETLVFKLCN